METTLILSDLHINSTVALCKPAAVLDDGGSYRPSPGQYWLWDKWEDMLNQIEKKRAGPLYTVINGDAVEGDAKGRSDQLITRNPATIVRFAADILDPLARMSAGFFMTRGTPAHVGKSGNLEESVADDLSAVPDPATGNASWWGLLWESDGVTMDIAHHPKGGGGGRPMNSQGMIDRLASDALFEYANQGRKPPKLVIRSHIHQYKDSRDAFGVRAITTPAWTLATEYIHRIAPHAIADIGGVMIHCSAGNYEVEVIRYQPLPAPFVSAGEIVHGNHGK
jgi:hypothetical protein